VREALVMGCGRHFSSSSSRSLAPGVERHIPSDPRPSQNANHA
jgi:hypothetical protein